ncbi:ribonuclease Z [Candidatus Woesearchaeota archaeon]|nr:ribonuclease Z [Candidatus Woesearchaeota archaeon]
MQLTFLGTSSMVPTKDRNVTSLFVSYKNEGILVDCGEGTQRQMSIAGLKHSKITKILITHWHGDHVSGLIGLFQTIGNFNENPKIILFGPKDTRKRIDHLLQTVQYDTKLALEVIELNPKGVQRFFETEDYALECTLLDHSTPCLGYNIIEKDKRRVDTEYLKKHKIKDGPHLKKLVSGQSIMYKGKAVPLLKATKLKKGKKLTIVMDTQVCTSAVELAQDADVLVSESAYKSDLQEKAEEYKHMTTKDATLVANNANVKKLYLTHFSQRYKSTVEIEEDARAFFQNTYAAYDFLKVKV